MASGCRVEEGVDGVTPGIVKGPGVPNITGNTVSDSNASTFTGAFYVNGGLSGQSAANQGTGIRVMFDASRCSAIYGNSTVVRPKTFGTIPVVYLGSQFIDGNKEIGAANYAGLPNITGVFQIGNSKPFWANNHSGAFYGSTPTACDSYGGGAGNNRTSRTVLDASRSSSVYGASTTVQPPSYCVIPCCYLGSQFLDGKVVGGVHGPGLPNIEGEIDSSSIADENIDFLYDYHASGLACSGALYIGSTRRQTSAAAGSGRYDAPSSIVFDGSRSNSIYGSSTTVRPRSFGTIPVVYLGSQFLDGVTPGIVKGPGLPNITGSISATGLSWSAQTSSGALSWQGSGNLRCSQSNIYDTPSSFAINASASSAIYGNSAVVRPKTFGAIPVVYLGNQFVDGSKSVGAVKSAGLPNITGSVLNTPGANSYGGQANTSGAGAFTVEYSSCLLLGMSGRTQANHGFSFSAANSNAIYGSSTTVQPPSYCVYPCVYLGA